MAKSKNIKNRKSDFNFNETQKIMKKITAKQNEAKQILRLSISSFLFTIESFQIKKSISEIFTKTVFEKTIDVINYFVHRNFILESMNSIHYRHKSDTSIFDSRIVSVFFRLRLTSVETRF